MIYLMYQVRKKMKLDKYLDIWILLLFNSSNHFFFVAYYLKKKIVIEHDLKKLKKNQPYNMTSFMNITIIIVIKLSSENTHFKLNLVVMMNKNIQIFCRFLCLLCFFNNLFRIYFRTLKEKKILKWFSIWKSLLQNMKIYYTKYFFTLKKRYNFW